MYDLLNDLRVLEAASFVAGPSCGLHLLQMGAEVIRLDPPGGGPDFTRWPRAENGASFYWEGLNRGKKSVVMDLAGPQGRELAQALAAEIGLLVTNHPAKGFLAHAGLAARRADMVSVRVMGWADGRNALDYTVNAAVGVPLATGPDDDGERPINAGTPAWDLTTGLYAAFAVLAAERNRRASGQGGEVRIPLGDMALATLANLGQFGEIDERGSDRERVGNNIYGAFGRDFATRDGRRVMIAAISRRQWTGLVRALGLEAPIAALEQETGADFTADEALRYVHRERINPLVEAAVQARELEALGTAFDAHGVTWGPYQTLAEALRSDPRFSAANPMLSPVEHLSGRTYLTAGAVATLPERTRGLPTRAPRLGEHTEAVLAEVLRLSSAEIGRLADQGVVACA
jgi:2-methylfumaryl-CoA isomerase